MRWGANSRGAAPEPPGPPLLLDQAGLAAIGAAAARAGDPPGPVARMRPSRRRRVTRFGLRSLMLAVAVFTVVTIGVGAPGAFSDAPSFSAFARLGLLALASIALGGQLGGLIPRPSWLRRSPREAPSKPYLYLDTVPLSAIAERAAALPPVAIRISCKGSRLAANWSWFALAVAVLLVLLAAALGSLVAVVVVAARGKLFTAGGSLTVGVLLLTGMGLYGTGRLVWRSLDEPRLRRRKRALQRLLRALLNWLPHSGRRASATLAPSLPSFLGICLAATLALAASFGGRLAGESGPGLLEAFGDPGSGGGPAGSALPAGAATLTPGAATTSASPGTQPAGGTEAAASGAGAGDGQGAGGDLSGGAGGGQGSTGPGATSPGGAGGGATATATQPSGGGSANATPTRASAQPGGGGSPSATATRTRTQPVSGASPTRTPTRTPTATPTKIVVLPTDTPPPTPTPVDTPTLEPTSTPTLEPTPTPTLEPTATPTPVPTATLVPTPTPNPCSVPGGDCDGDGVSNATEDSLGSDKTNPNSKPEHLDFGDSCVDGKDNDLDGKTDYTQDEGCAGIII